MIQTSYVTVDSMGDLFPGEMRDFILEGQDPRAVVDATATPYAPGPGGGGTEPYAPGPGGGGTLLEVGLVSGLRPDGMCFVNATVRNVGAEIVSGFALQWAITW